MELFVVLSQQQTELYSNVDSNVGINVGRNVGSVSGT